MYGAGQKYTEKQENGYWCGTLGSLQHTEKEQQRAKEAKQTLRIAIKEVRASTQNRSKDEEEAVERRQEKKQSRTRNKNAPRTGRAHRREDKE